MFNVIRSVERPASLARERRYDEEDVYLALREIFFDKCYICESKTPQDVNVEHFRPHLGDSAKKFDWANLYLACSRCNNVKRDGYDNILDCCDEGVDVFRAIRHFPPVSAFAKAVQITAMSDEPQVMASCELLNKVFNSDHTANKRVSGEWLRRKIYDQYSLLFRQMETYFSPLTPDLEKERSLDVIKVLIRRSSPYSAFMRWLILDDNHLGPMLSGYMD